VSDTTFYGLDAWIGRRKIPLRVVFLPACSLVIFGLLFILLCAVRLFIPEGLKSVLCGPNIASILYGAILISGGIWMITLVLYDNWLGLGMVLAPSGVALIWFHPLVPIVSVIAGALVLCMGVVALLRMLHYQRLQRAGRWSRTKS